jgi:hypothetical protein
VRWLAGLFLIAHGLVHPAVWATPFDPARARFDPRHSWLAARAGLEEVARSVAVGLALVAAGCFLLAGIAVLGDASWAPGVAIAGAVVSLVLTVVSFNRWLWLNVVINAAILVIALW